MTLVVITLVAYFLLLLTVSYITSRKARDNDTFFRGSRKSPWYLVAFGMIGASISGVSFVSVPGMVSTSQMTYLQMCFGFFFGYFIVAFVLLPIYYKLHLTSIYQYLDKRLGRSSYHTGALFFLLSKITGAAARFYLVCLILQQFVFDAMGIPYVLTVLITLLLIWLYTRRGGIKTLVWTDTLQTFCLIAALITIIVSVATKLNLNFSDVVQTISDSPMSRVFVMDDWISKQNFWKQFFSGIFIVIVMTGLDQDMMQKNLTCRTLREAQKDMCSYGFCFIPVNLLFLALGVLLIAFAPQIGSIAGVEGDALLPTLISSGWLGNGGVILFTLGVLAAAFSSADSALTALTTSFCIDILGVEQKKKDTKSAIKMRNRVHLGMILMFVVFTLLFKALNSTSVINAIYIMASYTYGPLLGLFAFGIFTRRQPRDRFVPYIAVCSPLFCYLLNIVVLQITGYAFGYELLMLNGLLTFMGLWTTSSKPKQID
ncbi:MAG: sodium:solute symporter [Bacteroidaceae bacterium]